MKKYIKPSIVTIEIDTTAILSGSITEDTKSAGILNNGSLGAKGMIDDFDFDDEEDY